MIVGLFSDIVAARQCILNVRDDSKAISACVKKIREEIAFKRAIKNARCLSGFDLVPWDPVNPEEKLLLEVSKALNEGVRRTCMKSLWRTAIATRENELTVEDAIFLDLCGYDRIYDVIENGFKTSLWKSGNFFLVRAISDYSLKFYVDDSRCPPLPKCKKYFLRFVCQLVLRTMKEDKSENISQVLHDVIKWIDSVIDESEDPNIMENYIVYSTTKNEIAIEWLNKSSVYEIFCTKEINNSDDDLLEELRLRQASWKYSEDQLRMVLNVFHVNSFSGTIKQLPCTTLSQMRKAREVDQTTKNELFDQRFPVDFVSRCTDVFSRDTFVGQSTLLNSLATENCLVDWKDILGDVCDSFSKRGFRKFSINHSISKFASLTREKHLVKELQYMNKKNAAILLKDALLISCPLTRKIRVLGHVDDNLESLKVKSLGPMITHSLFWPDVCCVNMFTLEYDSTSIKEQIHSQCRKKGFLVIYQTRILPVVKKVHEFWPSLSESDINVAYISQILESGIGVRDGKFNGVPETIGFGETEIGELVMDAPVYLGNRTVFLTLTNRYAIRYGDSGRAAFVIQSQNGIARLEPTLTIHEDGPPETWDLKLVA